MVRHWEVINSLSWIQSILKDKLLIQLTQCPDSRISGLSMCDLISTWPWQSAQPSHSWLLQPFCPPECLPTDFYYQVSDFYLTSPIPASTGWVAFLAPAKQVCFLPICLLEWLVIQHHPVATNALYSPLVHNERASLLNYSSALQSRYLLVNETTFPASDVVVM